MPDKTAIIVEDDQNWARLHRVSMNELGFSSSIARGYAEAVSLLRSETFDLAVIDLCLKRPDELVNLNGIFLLEYIVSKQTPVIIVTGLAFRELVDEIFKSFGVFAIIDKLSFNKKNFMDYVVNATECQLLQSDNSKRKRPLAHEKIEQLVLELLEKMPERPHQMRKSESTISAVKPTPPSQELRVFISHSSTDNEFAQRLAKDLRAAGFDIWFDGDQIHVGDTIIDMIAKGVAKCDYMIIILSPEAVESAWVRSELLMFLNEELERNKTVVLPVLFRKCERPTALRGRHFADFRESYEAGFAELQKGLGL